MKPTPFIMLPFTVPASTGGTIDPALVTQMFPSSAEPLAVAHWLLGRDNLSRIDLFSDQPLSVVGAAPTNNAGYISIPAGSNGLLSDYDETATQTICSVTKKISSPSVHSIMGTWPASGDAFGSLVYALSGDYSLVTKNIGGSAAGVAQTITVPGSAGDWIFIAMAHTTTGRTGFVGGGTSYTATGTRPLVAGNPIGLGKQGSVTVPSGLDAAEFIVFDTALTAAEMAAVYLRSKARLAARGITVV